MATTTLNDLAAEQQQFSTAWDSGNELDDLEREIQTKAKLPYQGQDFQEMLVKRKQLRQTLGVSPKQTSVAQSWLQEKKPTAKL